MAYNVSAVCDVRRQAHVPAALLVILDLHLFPPAEAAEGRVAKTAWLSGVEPGTSAPKLPIESRSLRIEAPVKARTRNRIRIEAQPAATLAFLDASSPCVAGVAVRLAGGAGGESRSWCPHPAIALRSESSARPELRRSFLPTRKVRGSTWRNPALAEPRERISVRCSPTASPAMPSPGCGRGAKTWLQTKDDVAPFHPRPAADDERGPAPSAACR
jgi:hypothetical protein